jgi:hypothetical protein
MNYADWVEMVWDAYGRALEGTTEWEKRQGFSAHSVTLQHALGLNVQEMPGEQATHALNAIHQALMDLKRLAMLRATGTEVNPNLLPYGRGINLLGRNLHSAIMPGDGVSLNSEEISFIEKLCELGQRTGEGGKYVYLVDVYTSKLFEALGQPWEPKQKDLWRVMRSKFSNSKLLRDSKTIEVACPTYRAYRILNH